MLSLRTFVAAHPFAVRALQGVLLVSPLALAGPLQAQDAAPDSAPNLGPAAALAAAPAVAVPDHVPGQLLVKARAGQQAALAARLTQLLPGAAKRAAFPHRDAAHVDRVGLARIVVVDVAPGTEPASLALLAAEPSVEWAELNGRTGGITGQTLPNDPSFPSQWALNQASDIDMDVPEAWFLRGTTESSSLLVADIDTGYDTNVTSPDWAGVVWTNQNEVQNGLDDDGNGLVDDVHGYDFAYNDSTPDAANSHGVETGGIIAARTQNGAQVAGLASGVTILPIKIFDNSGFFPFSGPYAGFLSGSTGLVYAADHDADLVNNSWTVGTSPVQIINDALQYCEDNGTRCIFAAGNNGTNQGWPAQNPLVIAVAAIDRFGIKSNWGFQSSTYGSWVDVCAAGTDVTTTTTFGAVDNFFAGTSAACPQAVGVAAMVLSEDGDLTTSDVRTILMQGAVSVDALNPSWVGLLGAGQVNAYNSLALLSAWSDLGSALAGDFAPILNAWGLTGAGARIYLSLSHAAPNAPALLVAGFGTLNAPFKGGMLVPTTDIVLPLSTSPAGNLVLSPGLPGALPAGPLLRVQYIMADAGAPAGYALSNAVLLTVP